MAALASTPGSWGRQLPNVTLLGEFALDVGGMRAQLPFSAQRLVAFVALQRRQLSREFVAGRLWPESGSAQALASLRTALWRVRRVGLVIIDSTRDCLSLADNVSVDVHQVTDLVPQLIDPSNDFPVDKVSVSDLQQELLPSWLADDWVLIERERLRQLCLHGLEALCQRLRAEGRFAEAIEAGFAAVSGEPLRESAQRALILVHFAEGNPGEALRQYRGYRKLLHDELGLDPSSQITKLFEGFPAA
jgi:DNA-binding SARP family transcriptional activator